MAIGDANRQQMLERAKRDPRRQWGWGASPMASEEEQQAYRALDLQPEIAAGRATIADLPEAYGGRPQGTSRRSIRMQQAWDAEQAARIQQEQAIRQQEEAFRKEQREGWRFMKEQNEYAAKEKLDALNERDSAQESYEANAIASGLEGINFKDDPEAGLKIDQLILDNPLGAARPEVAKRLEAAKRINETYGAAALTKAGQEESKAKSEIINNALRDGVTEQEIEATKFADPKTAVVDYDYEKIARLAAQRTGERKAEKPEETPEEKRAKATEAEIADERKGLKTSIRNIEDSIAETESDLETLRANSPDRKKVEAKISTLKKQLENRKSQLTDLGGDNQPPSFDTPEEAEAANLPKGTIVVIGGRRARID